MRFFIRNIAVWAFVLSCGAWGLSAQFTIQRAQEAEKLKIETAQPTPFGDLSIQPTYFDRAAWMAEKRRLRKERNTIQLDAMLQTSMQGYENWSASADNSLNALASLFFRHRYAKDRFSLDYRFEANYGMNMVSDAEATKVRDRFFKNKDEFRFNLNMGWAIHNNWSYSAATNFRSQFTKGYPARRNYARASNFLAPGYFDVAVGFSYNDPKKPFNIIMSPLSGSVTMVLDRRIWEHVEDGGSKYGVSKGEKFTGHIGPSAQVDFDMQFGKKKGLRYRSTLYAFTSYAHPLDTPLIRWDNTFEMRISRLFSARLYGQAFYKKEDVDWIQYQYAFTIGIAYHFKNK